MSPTALLQPKHRTGNAPRRSSTGFVAAPRPIAMLCGAFASAAMMGQAPVAAAQVSTVSAEQIGSLAMPPAGTVTIERTRGDIRIEGWDEARISVRVTARSKAAVPTADAGAAKNDLGGFATRIVQASPSRIVITALSPGAGRLKRFGGKRGVALTYTINMPRTASLVLRHSVGSVEVTGLKADLNVVAGVGDIHIKTPLAPAVSVAASATIGDVSVAARAGGGVHRQHALLGQRYTDAPVGAVRHVVARVRIGSVEID